jgi:hypothetical protein
MRAWLSFSMSLGVVPEETRAWKPERAPQAMVMKRKGKRFPANAGPVPSLAKWVTAGICTEGMATRMPSASRAMVPTFMKVER